MRSFFVLKIVFLFLAFCGMASCLDATSPRPAVVTSQDSSLDSSSAPAPVIDTLTLRLSAVGDLMVHRWQMTKAYDKRDSTFDFSCAFEWIEPHFARSDFLVGNLETTFAGRNKGRGRSTLGYSCFPNFNAPDAFGVALRSAGFDLLSTINNHSFDSYVGGLRSTLRLLDSLGIKSVGTALPGERARTQVVDVKGVRLGFCAYTTTLNGYRLPDSLSYCANVIKGLNKESFARLRSDIDSLKAQGVDALFAILHFGTEYQRKPNKAQRTLVDSLFAYGVDVVLGSHPHIVQPMEVRTVVGADSVKRRCVAFYSLGNFISSQRWDKGLDLSKDIGLMVDLELEKVGHSTKVKTIVCKPVYTFWRRKCIGVVPVLDALADSLLYSKMNAYDRKRLCFAAEDVPKMLFPDRMKVDTLSDGFRIDVDAVSDAPLSSSKNHGVVSK